MGVEVDHSKWGRLCAPAREGWCSFSALAGRSGLTNPISQALDLRPVSPFLFGREPLRRGVAQHLVECEMGAVARQVAGRPALVLSQLAGSVLVALLVGQVSHIGILTWPWRTGVRSLCGLSRCGAHPRLYTFLEVGRANRRDRRNRTNWYNDHVAFDGLVTLLKTGAEIVLICLCCRRRCKSCNERR